MKKKDMEDRSYVSEGTLMDDERYKEYNFYYKVYPYTVDCQEEDEHNGILDFDDWRPLYASGISTQHSKYVVIAPRDYLVRFKPVNCNYQPVITESGDKKIYTWEAGNLPARTMEPSGPKWKEIAPYVLIAPSDFEAQGYKGNMSSWMDYGKFINQLRTGRDVLPDDIKKKAHELTDNLKDPRQKVYALYDFLQKNTHYISIQLGIGGWQPFPADYVAAKRYGDCKALSNYTESPGYLGSFTGDRKAILIDEDGGHVVKTPSYSASDNTRCRAVTAEINSEGNLDAEVNTVYSGLRQELPHGLITEVSADEREKYLNRLFHLPTYKVDKSHYEEQKGMVPIVKEYLHVLSPNYASVSGKRLFIVPNLFDKSNYRLPADSVRLYDFIDKEAFTDIDSKFGKYTASVKVMPDKIIYYRKWEEGVNRFPPSDYAGLVKFYEQLYKADHNRVVLVKN